MLYQLSGMLMKLGFAVVPDRVLKPDLPAKMSELDSEEPLLFDLSSQGPRHAQLLQAHHAMHLVKSASCLIAAKEWTMKLIAQWAAWAMKFYGIPPSLAFPRHPAQVQHSPAWHLLAWHTLHLMMPSGSHATTEQASILVAKTAA
jgi:hypothetical protein